MNYYLKIRKRVLLFSFLFFSKFLFCQTFIRNSDEKIFDSITVINNNKKILLNKINFKNYKFNSDDRVLYNNKLLEFSISNDSIFFFDKVREIEEVQIIGENLKTKREKNLKSKELKNVFLKIFINQHSATYIKINSKTKTYIKSLTVFLEPKMYKSNINESIQIKILKNVNGFPDIDSPILSFQAFLPEMGSKKWEIILPNIIKYPKDGFFVDFYYESDKNEYVLLKTNNESSMYFYYPQTKQWKKLNFNGYLYKLKVLQ